MARIDDGFGALISFGSNSAAPYIWEKGITPPGVDGGDAVETTTLRNSVWRTMSPRKLKTLTQIAFRAAYDPAVYESILSLINVNQEITITFPDNTTLKFWGWLKNFTPGELSEGTQAEAECVIVPSNQNNSGQEVSPTYSG